ncbi:hypothetical protein ACMYSQ_012504 [Aspergillus niger]
MRQMIGLMCQQQQVLLQRVNSLEQWQSQVVAQMSSGGTPGANSNHSGQSQTECQQHIPAIQSAQHDTVSDVVQTDHVSASAAPQGVACITIQPRSSVPPGHDQESQNEAVQPTPRNGGSHLTQTKDVSDKVHHQEGQQLSVTQEEESQNEEQQQQCPSKTQGRSNRRPITDQRLRQREDITRSTSGSAPPRSEHERQRKVSVLSVLPMIMEPLQQTPSISQSGVIKQE